MRTFKKGDRTEKTKDQFIIDALLQGGFVEVVETPKVEEPEKEEAETPKGKRH